MSLKSFIQLFFVATICMKLFSCKNDLSSANDYLIKVDSIHAPDSILSNNPFEIVFFGIAGLNTCQSFKTFNIKFNNKDVHIESWGTDNSDGNPCGEGIIYLSGQKVTLKFFP